MRVLFFSIFLLLSSSAIAQKYTISGYITDGTNGESILGANIVADSLRLGTSSNNYGFYSLTLPEGKYNIIYTFIGYSPQEIYVNLTKDMTQNIEFYPTTSELDEINLLGEKNIVESTQSSVINVL